MIDKTIKIQPNCLLPNNVLIKFRDFKMIEPTPSNTIDEFLAEVNSEAKKLITSFASQAFNSNDPNKFTTEFSSMLKIAFGDSYREQDAINLFQQFAQGNFDMIPIPKILSNETIMGIDICYARQKNQIYINERFLLENLEYSVALGASLVEEYGHFIDSQINDADTLGDEGRIFAMLVIVEELKKASDSELDKMRDKLTMLDHTTIFVEGKSIEVEMGGGRSRRG